MESHPEQSTSAVVLKANTLFAQIKHTKEEMVKFRAETVSHFAKFQEEVAELSGLLKTHLSDGGQHVQWVMSAVRASIVEELKHSLGCSTRSATTAPTAAPHTGSSLSQTLHLFAHWCHDKWLKYRTALSVMQVMGVVYVFLRKFWFFVGILSRVNWGKRRFTLRRK